MGCAVSWGKEDERTFVDNIPVRAFSSVPSHDLVDVVLHDIHQRSIVVNLVYPARQLAVPDQCMASHLLAVLRREVRNCISSAPVELILVRLSCVPFHRILRRDGAEF